MMAASRGNRRENIFNAGQFDEGGSGPRSLA